MIRIAVCDDDELFISGIMKPLLSRALKITGIYAEIDFYTNGLLLLNEFERHHNYNIVLMDIDMPSINGKELAGKLRSLDKDFRLAFISAYKEEVYDVFSLNTADFIPKEYDKNKCLDKLIGLLKRYASEKPQQILFSILENGKHAVIKINPDNIFYIKLIKGKVIIFISDKELISANLRSLKNLEKELSPLGFYKIHGNILVNVGKVYEVSDNEVILNNNVRLPISRRRRKDLLAILSKIISARVIT